MLELDDHLARLALDREGALEDFLKARLLGKIALAKLFPLKETLKRRELDVDEIGKLHRFLEILANVAALDLVFGICHPLPS